MVIKSSKRGQIAVFVIIAIVIVGILLILLIPNVRKIFIPNPVDIEIKECLQERVEKVLPLVLAKGGNLDPELYYTYNGENLDYLCYTNEFYKTCVMQKPLLKQNIEAEIEAAIQEDVKICVKDMKERLEKQGYSIDATGGEGVEVNFIPKRALIKLDMDIIARQEDETRTFNNLNTEIKTNAYKMIMVASSISNFEARYGDSIPEDYMTYYEDIKVEKLKQIDGTTIYLITDRDSDLELNFASRSLAWPPGYGY